MTGCDTCLFVVQDTGSTSPPPKHAEHADKLASTVINDAPADNIMADYGSQQQDSKSVPPPDVSQGQAVGSSDQAVGVIDQAVGINDQPAGTHAHSKSKKKNKKTKKSAGAQKEQAGTSISNANASNNDRKTAPVTNTKGSRLASASHPSSASKTTGANTALPSVD